MVVRVGPVHGTGKYYIEELMEERALFPELFDCHTYGKAARHLGVHGHKHDAAALWNMHQGLSPDAKARIAPKHPGRQAGWELNFGAPFSASCLLAVRDTEGQKEVIRAHQAAVLKVVETMTVVARRGRGGKNREVAYPLVYLKTELDNRLGHPNLHTHAVFPNVGLRLDGTWGAIESRESLYKRQRKLSRRYDALLARELKLRNYRLARDRFSFKVKGLPRKLLKAFSERTRQIKEYMAIHGLFGPLGAKIAARVTRPKKMKVPLSTKLLQWQEKARECRATVQRVLRNPIMGTAETFVRRRLRRNVRDAIATIQKNGGELTTEKVVRMALMNRDEPAPHETKLQEIAEREVRRVREFGYTMKRKM